ncbi:cytochrome (ubi)quinol oxidase subunit III [Gluconobacter morbifer]|uniref:Cytochrome bo(3) ubiquinol oxidase subunit 3 n=1 Tax=Gluconobacter morbifer G707 TaxID=1088869 RepID=G6XJP1_9PROT|nr:cytochrome (ubi)quinol oxidase subunit III [Gluconobacter morbifer]EHH67853.1 cytochrome-c oxidase subunit 3 [Gluconobacter morbifer G707]
MSQSASMRGPSTTGQDIERHGRDHTPLGQPHTETQAREESEEVMFGFWIFLMSDLVIFAMVFATYGVMRDALAGGPGPKGLFDLNSAAIETVVLLSSSFTCGMSTLSAKYEESAGRTVAWLIVTLLLGFVFLGFEVHDFMDMVSKGGVPSRSGWLSALFTLIGTHGLHVTVGCLWGLVMIVQLFVFGLDQDVQTRLMRFGLFWHFLDIIWIGIFSVVYLLGLAP